MTAIVEIVHTNGASPADNDITSANLRFDASDTSSTASTAAPIAIPTSGSNYSYWRCTRLKVTGGTFTQVDNIKWFTDGGNGLGTGVTLNVGTSDSYTQATGSSGTGTQLTDANYTGGTLSTPADAFGKTSGSPLSVNGTLTTAGHTSDYVVLQLAVASTASPGTTSGETITWQYDEV